ncbi:hypothetical protein BU16DRAFT_568183 [Lophium mytilinum]|uniref:Apple domain-containing protein n=1 Tax=Lophium mytilinum TaxID=390894 RepID=A0A6A6Q9H5_9PEZI|nr:hypothetical protein BU16DRAFT_568183 [Lophium mytilinum]
MHIRSLPTLSALLLSIDLTAAGSTVSSVKCSTKYGPKSVAPVKTASYALTVPLYWFKITTLTPQATTTPPVTTTTLSFTSTSTVYTTLDQVTDTFSSTSTVLESVTITETETDSVTETDTYTSTSTPSTTIPASAGFTPISSNIANSSKKRRSAGKPADALVPEIDERAATGTKFKLSLKNGKIACSPAVYPQAVTCAGVVKVYSTKTLTVTAKKTHTNTAPTPTSTTSTTITETSTSTITPIDASTTLSFTETDTLTFTESDTATVTVATVTNTVGAVAPTSTYYAACAPNNVISTVNGQGIVQAYYNNPNYFSSTGAGSGYDCCVACITTSGCGGTYGAPGACYLLMEGSGCSQSQEAYELELGGSGDQGIYASNGYCGKNVIYSS